MSGLDRRLRRLEVEGRRADLWTEARRFAAALGISPAELMAEAERIAASGFAFEEEIARVATEEGIDSDELREESRRCLASLRA